MKTEGIYLAGPLYDGRIEAGAAAGMMVQSSVRPGITNVMNVGSLITLNMNSLWAGALNAREDLNLKWFAMLHSDVVPESGWLDTLIDEAEKQDADFLSACIPIKDSRGLTSTGLFNPANPWSPLCRVTLKQLWHEQMPETFDAVTLASALTKLPESMRVDLPEDWQWENAARTSLPRYPLLANTGCMVCRIDKPWAEDVFFEQRDRISKVNGKYRAQAQSEDWMFSRAVQERGAKVMATRKVRCLHRGMTEYASDGTWGWERDNDCAQRTAEAAQVA